MVVGVEPKGVARGFVPPATGSKLTGGGAFRLDNENEDEVLAKGVDSVCGALASPVTLVGPGCEVKVIGALELVGTGEGAADSVGFVGTAEKAGALSGFVVPEDTAGAKDDGLPGNSVELAFSEGCGVEAKVGRAPDALDAISLVCAVNFLSSLRRLAIVGTFSTAI